MSLFSTGPSSPPLDSTKAWAYTAANLLLWPGLGTALAKRKIGLVQMGVSGAGAVMFIIGLFGFFARWVNTELQPGWRDQYSLTGLGGVALVVFTWFWALLSSISIIRAGRRNELRLPPRF